MCIRDSAHPHPHPNSNPNQAPSAYNIYMKSALARVKVQLRVGLTLASCQSIMKNVLNFLAPKTLEGGAFLTTLTHSMEAFRGTHAVGQ